MASNEQLFNVPTETEEERQELTQRPISQQLRKLTLEQVAIRRRIAQRLCDSFIRADPTLTPELRAVYDAWPMWGFYTDKQGKLPRRGYGVMLHGEEEKEPWLHMVTAHFLWTNDVVGGVPCSELRRVDNWSHDTELLLQANNEPGVFVDPLGFLFPLCEHAV